MRTYTKHGIAAIADNTADSTIPVIEVKDPDNGMNMPIYTGIATNASRWLVPGVYDATVQLDSFGTTMDVLLIVTDSVSYTADRDGIPFSGRINAFQN